MALAFNPISKKSQSAESGLGARFGADIALVTANHPDYNGLENLSFGERAPFALTGPGDYEVSGIFISGVASEAEISGQHYVNTIYSFSLDKINIVFLGALANPEISKEARESINNPDILFVPIGGKRSDGPVLLDAKSSAKMALSLEPALIIPMDWDESSLSLKAFLKETGEEKAEMVEKLTLKPKDLEGREGEVIVLRST